MKILVAITLALIALLIFWPRQYPAGGVPAATQTPVSSDYDINVQVRIHKQTELGEFNDAVYYSLSDWSQLSQKALDAAVQERADAWVDKVKNAPTPLPLTKQQLQAQAAELQAQLIDVTAKINETP